MNNGTDFFPRYIDKQRLVGVIEMDEFFAFFGITMGSMVLAYFTDPSSSGLLILGAVSLGLAAVYGLRKLKKNRPDGYTVHLLYKKGIIHPQDNKKDFIKSPYLKEIKTVPYGFTKEFLN